MKVEGNTITMTDYEKAILAQFLTNAQNDFIELGEDYSIILETHVSKEQMDLLKQLHQML